MLELWTCARGHFWEHDGGEAGQQTTLTCPACGAPGVHPGEIDLVASEPLPPIAEVAEPPILDATNRPLVPGYEILEDLPRGPTGIRRYRARQLAAGREVLLEVVLAKEDTTQRAWSSLRGEAGALGKLAHPHIQTLLDAGERQRLLFFNALSLPSGPTLDQKVAEKWLPVEQVLPLMEVLARTMQFAHDRGVVHRHLEPQVIHLRPGGLEAGGGVCMVHGQGYIPEIGGFGLSRRPVEGDATDAELFVDAGYLSPEQAWGRTKDIGPATDIYGLGGILYFLLTGRPPFRGPSLSDVLDAVQSSPLVSPKNFRRIGDDLTAICEMSLGRNPRRRYKSPGALADDLRRVTFHLAPKANPGSTSLRFLRWVYRRPAVAGLLATAVLGVAGTVTGYVTGRREGETGGEQLLRTRFELQMVRNQEQQSRLRLNQLEQQLRVADYRQKLRDARAELDRMQPQLARVALEACDHRERRIEWFSLVQQAEGRRPVVRKIPRLIGLACDPRNSQRLVVLSRQQDNNGALVQILNALTGELLTQTRIEGLVPGVLAFSPDGQKLAITAPVKGIGGAGNSVVACYVLNQPFRGRPSLGLACRVSLAVRGVNALAFRPDGWEVAVAGAQGEWLRLETSTGQREGAMFPSLLQVGEAQSYLAYRPDGGAVFVASREDRRVIAWDLATRQVLFTLDRPGQVRALAVSSQGLLAVARSDSSVYVHDAQTGELKATIQSLPRGVTRIAFTPDGERMALACEDDRIRIFAPAGAGWSELIDLPAEGVLDLAFSAGGRALAVASADQLFLVGQPGE